MSNLSNQQIKNSFPGLLQVPGGITSTLKTVQDGNGNPTGLQISSAGASVTTSNTFVASISGTQITGAVPRLISDGFGDVISVKDFGAVGNGVADDTAAIQTAVNAAANKALYFPAGTYLISTVINLPSYTNLFGDGAASILKIKTGSYASGPRIFVVTSANHDVSIDNLSFDGNKGNVGTARGEIITLYVGYNYSITNCNFSSCEGICLNISTVSKNIYIDHCTFTNCGGNPDNSDGYRKQAIAFSNTGGVGETRTRSVSITNCKFDTQGLDCISINNCDDVIISGNTSKNSYTLLYNNPDPRYSTNVTVTNNACYNTTQGSYVSSTPPVAIDLPAVRTGVVANNVITECAASGIGIFAGSINVVVTGNSIVNSVNAGTSWIGGISIGTAPISGSATIDNITIASNIINNLAGGATMPFGLLIQSTVVNTYIANNLITGATISTYGYYTAGDPSITNAYALTDNTNIAASVTIEDVTTGTGTITNWRKANTLTSYSVDGVQVVTNQQTAVVDAVAGTEIATINAILARLRTHGLIST